MTRIDCDTCVVRGLACHDCVVTVLLGPPPQGELDAAERTAIDVLAGSGLVPPLRLVRPARPEATAPGAATAATPAPGRGLPALPDRRCVV